MKTIISGFFLLFSFSIYAQSGIQFQDLSYKDLLSKAKKENKLLFIDAMASWCGPCKLMDKNVFSKKEVGDYYNTNFVNAKFDMEKGEGRDLAKQFGVYSYPTFLYVNGEGQLISMNRGYMAESLFLELGKEANAATQDSGSMKDRFEKGDNDPTFLVNIIRLYANSDYDFAKQASERYFKNKKTKEFTKDEVGYLLYFIKSTDDSNYKYFKQNKEDLVKIITEKVYNDFENQLQMADVVQNSIDEKNKEVNDQFFLERAIPLLGKEAAERELHKLKLNYYELNDNFQEYEKAALKYYENSDKINPTELLKAAWVFLDKAKDEKSLKKAQEWAEKAVTRGETAENTYILAKLYQKTGKIVEAKMFAKASLDLAKSQGKDATMAENLLKELN